MRIDYSAPSAYINFVYVTGANLLQLHGSLPAALRHNFPDHSWQEWKFVHSPKRKSDVFEPANVIKFVKELATELNIENLDQWYDVTVQEIEKRTSM